MRVIRHFSSSNSHTLQQGKRSFFRLFRSESAAEMKFQWFFISIGQFNRSLNLYRAIVIGPLTNSGERKGKIKGHVVASSQVKHRNRAEELACMQRKV